VSKILYKIEVFWKDDDNIYSTTPDATITDGVAVDTDLGIESTADTFQFRGYNTKKPDGSFRFQNTFHIDDRIAIYLKVDSGTGTWTDSSDKRMDGLITELGAEVGDEGRLLIVKGTSRVEKMLNFVFPAVYTNQAASTIIQNLLGHVNDGQAQRPDGVRINQINWASGNATTTANLSYHRSYKPVFEMIEELSHIGINKTGNFIYYMDTDDNFVWLAKDWISSATITEGVDFNSIKVTTKVWDVINAMIVDCGVDAYGRTIVALYYDEISAAEFGLRWAPSKESETEIGQQLVNDCLTKMKNEGKYADTSNFPTGYPFTMPWNTRASNGDLTGAALTANSNTEFNSELRKEARFQGQEWAKSVVDLSGTVRPKIDVTLRGAHWYNASELNRPIQGDLLTVSSNAIQSTGVSQDEFRIIDMNHTLSRNGWMIDIRLEEDIESSVGV